MAQHNRRVEAAMSVVCYSSCSVSMILLNKLLTYTHGLPYPNSLLFCQNCGAFLLVTIAKQLHLISYPDFSWRVVPHWMPLTLLFVLMLYTSLKSLELMSVPVQTIVKNLAIVFTAFGDMYLYGKVITSGMFVAFGLMVIGSYMSAKGNPWVTMWGLVWTFLNIASTVGYTLYMKRLMARWGERIGRYGPVVYNNLLSLPFFLVGGWTELRPLFAKLLVSTWQAYLCLIVVTLISSVMTFAVFWCMQMTSPTTFSVVGALNKVPLAFLGIVVFQQYPDRLGYAGIAVALSGGFLYAYANVKSNERREHNKPQKETSHAYLTPVDRTKTPSNANP